MKEDPDASSDENGKLFAIYYAVLFYFLI